MSSSYWSNGRLMPELAGKPEAQYRMSLLSTISKESSWMYTLSTWVVVALLGLACVQAWAYKMRRKRSGKSRNPCNWPVLGMLPALLANMNNVYDWMTAVLIENGGSFQFWGPWFTTFNYFITADPRNVEHVLRLNFGNYPKGEEFVEMFRDLLGDGIFNADGELWRVQRKAASVQLNTRECKKFIEETVMGYVGGKLMPVLDEICETGKTMDLQELMLRFTFDTVCMVGFGVDMGCCSSSRSSMSTTSSSSSISNPKSMSASPSSISNPESMSASPSSISNPESMSASPSSISNPKSMSASPSSISNPKSMSASPSSNSKSMSASSFSSNSKSMSASPSLNSKSMSASSFSSISKSMSASFSNPKSMSASPSLSSNPFALAFEHALDCIAIRFYLPSLFWRTLRFLRLGKETFLPHSLHVISRFVDHVISSRHLEIQSHPLHLPPSKSDLLSCFMHLGGVDSHEKRKFLKDISINFILAGRDTSALGLSWFFWLVASHPHVEDKILEEIHRILRSSDGPVLLTKENLNRMTYLHAALSESLRLYPSVPLDIKHILKDDLMPDGNHVKKNQRLLYSIYAMGRMESIWGADCTSFRPERWFFDDGSSRMPTISPFHYPVFNAGPRTCLGKDMAYSLMKAVASTLLLHFRVVLVPEHKVVPKLSITLYMKHGLLVTLERRQNNQS